jgi:hypothetical protein
MEHLHAINGDSSTNFLTFYGQGIPIYSHDFPINSHIKPPVLVDMSYISMAIFQFAFCMLTIDHPWRTTPLQGNGPIFWEPRMEKPADIGIF